MAEVDRIQFERLLSNLLSNAIKYTPPGGEVRLELKPHGEPRRASRVEDTGRGIPREHLPHIFERFYRVPSTDSSDMRGLGLGLSFVDWIVKAHDGKIDVTSSVGPGQPFRGDSARDSCQRGPRGSRETRAGTLWLNRDQPAREGRDHHPGPEGASNGRRGRHGLLREALRGLWPRAAATWS